jgi:hypothetical protein
VPVIQFWVRRFGVLFLLALAAACGGGDGGGPSTPPFGSGSKVFAADEVNGAIGSTENSNPTPGSTVAITRIIAGSGTQIPVGPGCPGCLPSLALDSGRDQLYVSTRDNILVFNNAGTISGNVAPSRVLSGLGTGLRRHLALNTTGGADILYVSNPTGTILRLNSASTAGSLNAASLTLALTPFNGLNDTITDIALDGTRDVLYVGLSRGTFGAVGIIPNISAQTTTAAISAEIAVNATTPSITIDGPRNVLYVSGLQSGQVLVFDSASTLLAGALPNRTIQQLPAVTTQYRLFVETTNNRLYASGMNRVVILNSASTATTAVGAAVAQLSTMNSDLTAVVARP